MRRDAGSYPVCISFHFSKIGGIIDWFRKTAIMCKLFNDGGDWDGDLVTYKHHKYYVNIQTGTVMRIE